MKATGHILGALAIFGTEVQCAEKLRNEIYFDQYHVAILPGKNVTAGITHVTMSFANSSLFTGDTAGPYTPFMNVSDVRAMFDEGAEVGIAIGGWGDTVGFGAGAATEATRAEFAQNVAAMLESHGFDYVDIDWEYPGGNGADYRQIPNSEKTDEITTFPLLLKEIKTAIGAKSLSIAAPGLERDMIAYTPEQAASIWDAVDVVNVMTYDLMNRRDNATKHHSDVVGSLATIEKYISLGLSPCKINLGFAYYAKYFETEPGVNCSAAAVGCPIVKAENDDGSDAGTSGAITFEWANYHPTPAPTNLTASTDGTCGAGTFSTCQGIDETPCCGQYGYCGSTGAYCGAGCQSEYGTCTGPSIGNSFRAAMADPQVDEYYGGAWYWDASNELFWTFDAVDLISRKFEEIVAAKGLGGVMAWSLGEDSNDWSHLLAITEGVQALESKRK